MGRKRAPGNERLGEHIQRRSSGILELRFPIPPDVQHAFPGKDGRSKSFFIQSLGTRDPKLANAKADRLRDQLRQEIAGARTAPKAEGLNDYLVELYSRELDLFRRELAKQAKARQIAIIDPTSHQAKSLASERLTRSVQGTALLSPDRNEVAATADWAAEEFFGRQQNGPDRRSPEYRKVLEACAGTLADAIIAKSALEKDEPPPPPINSALKAALEGKALAKQAPPSSALPPNALTEKGCLPVNKFFETVYTVVEQGPNSVFIGERNIAGKRQSANLFVDLIGEKPISAISKGDLYEFHDQLRKLPDSRRLKGNLKKLSAKQLLKNVEDKALNLGSISPKTVNKHLSNISSIMDFAEKRRHIDRADAKGVKAAFRDTEDAGRPFTSAELNRIFSLPLFTGCAGEDVEGGLFKPGNVKIRDDRFWIPLLLLFTGGRSSEIVGLETADVVLEHETPHLLIIHNKTRPSLKNHHSKRMVPVHTKLLELGFKDFVKLRIENGDVRLFPMAGPTAYRDQSYGKAQRSLSATLIMRQFNRTHLKHADANGNRGSVKCFRNTFEQEASSKIASDEDKQRLTGRRVVSTSRIYTSNIPLDDEQRKAQLKKMKESLDLINYDFLDLSKITP